MKQKALCGCSVDLLDKEGKPNGRVVGPDSVRRLVRSPSALSAALAALATLALYTSRCSSTIQHVKAAKILLSGTFAGRQNQGVNYKSCLRCKDEDASIPGQLAEIWPQPVPTAPWVSWPVRQVGRAAVYLGTTSTQSPVRQLRTPPP